MKKILAMLLALVMVVGLCACAAAPAPEKTEEKPAADQAESADKEESADPMKITVAIASFDNTFASFIMARMGVFNESHPELEISYVDAANDAATQITQVEQAVINGTQAVICLPVDASQSGPIVTACKDGAVPLIAFNRIFDNCDTFDGADNAVAGRLVAEACGDAIGGSGKIALVQGIMGQANTYERTDSIVATLEEKYPDIEIVFDGAADWKRDKALELVETWLQSGEPFDAVICLNDDSGLGAQQALAAAGITDIPVFSINGDPSGIQGVDEGILACTAFQDPFAQADTALEIAMDYIQGGDPVKTFLVDYKLVTSENVKDYLQYVNVG